ncbi:MAG: putative amidohydrolase/ribosomal protein S18 acetylase RimI-like enzyme [Gammaproteobacteria bacterium]|jgi:predicted amidohydrolase/ribosomal protein S18 acetylase RimI-like enzyme
MEQSDDDAENVIRLRNITPADHDALERLENDVLSDLGGAWPMQTIDGLLKTFPEGQFCIEDNGRIVAAALTVRVNYNRFSIPHRYSDLVSNDLSIHFDPAGDALYGIDVMVDPEYRGYRFGRRLYDARKELCMDLNLRGILAGGRISGYSKHAEEMTPSEYIERVRKHELDDAVLNFQLSNDFQVKRIMRAYLPEDDASRGYATLLEWNNLYYESEETSLVETAKTEVRVGVVQWLMRTVSSFDEFLAQAESFVDSLSEYRADFVVFPEFFAMPLMGLGAVDAKASDAIRHLAEYTPRIVEALRSYAISYNVNIVGGSMPLYENNDIYNVAYLFQRNGRVDTQYKLHITPDERNYWMIRGGNDLRTFETDAGRVGILVCYDVEFPELARLQALQGMEILFVPIWTDTKNAFLRVQRCAQARAIENECYVVVAGSIGHLPQIDHLDLQYAQSAVYSPSDFAFPHDAVIAETTPNTEQVLVVDLNLDKLQELHNEGSVTNLVDRRTDLFQLKWTRESD